MLKTIVWLVTGLAVLAASLYFYYVHTPAVEPPALRGELRYAEVSSQGLQRGFHYYHSDSLAEGAALVFALHGSTSNGPDTRAAYGYRFDVLADEQALIPVYPTGYDNHWNDCRSAADYQANLKDIDDLDFVRAMIDYFAHNYTADPAKVLVTGISNGGHMAYKIALEAPALVVAIAPIAASLPVWEESDCSAQGQSVAVAIINGTADPVNPYQGGLVSIFGNSSRGTVMSSTATATYFAELAGHQHLTATLTLTDWDATDKTHIELSAWQAPGLKEVAHYTVVGGGHLAPSKTVRMPRLLGPGNRDIDAADEIWTFFQRVITAADEEPGRWQRHH